MPDIKKSLSDKLKIAPKIGYVIVIDLKEDGALTIDGTTHPAEVKDGAQDDAVTTLTTDTATFQKILDGVQDPNMAVMMGKMKISGKLGVAMKLASFLED